MNHFQSMVEFFSIVPDPRRDINKRHELRDIIVLVVLGILAGCDSWVDIGRWAEVKEQWLRTFLNLPNGIPSHDTLGRVIALLPPEVLKEFFRQWVRENTGPAKHIALDGKVFRASSSEPQPFSYLGMASAYSTDQGICVGYENTQLKHEKLAFEELVRALDLRGAVVSIDAGGMTPKILSAIKEKKADFLVCVKSPQDLIRRKIRKALDDGQPSVYEEKETKAHGREEKRVCEVVELDAEFNEKIKKARHRERDLEAHPNFWSCMRITSTRIVKGKQTTQERYYISSMRSPSAKRSCDLIRSHWAIENTLHWSLDVTFAEDRCTVRNRRAAQNMGALRRFAFNLYKLETTKKSSLRGKRKIAGWDDEYLMRVVSHAAQL